MMWDNCGNQGVKNVTGFIRRELPEGRQAPFYKQIADRIELFILLSYASPTTSDIQYSSVHGTKRYAGTNARKSDALNLSPH
jgi:hypothetical protein